MEVGWSEAIRELFKIHLPKIQYWVPAEREVPEEQVFNH
jgi:hypothetical protein